jgi:CPA2 family monovalent cation:H+ antiporter-2
MAHLPALIVDLAIILGAAATVTLLFKKLKQPLVLGYIIAGFIVGPHFPLFPTITDYANIQVWAEIGVIFLLFGLGLEFSFKKLYRVGGSSVVTGAIEVSFMFTLGYLLGRALEWNNIDSLFLGGILSISSTSIIIRTFSELNIKSQKFTQTVFGVLVFEDLVAIVLMVLLSTVSIGQQLEGAHLATSTAKLIFFLVLWFIAGIFIVPTLLRKTKSLMNEETMMVVALGLCLFMVVVASQAGFSPALGAFIMGSILAETREAEKITAITEPIRNLFGIVFFVSVGVLLDPSALSEYFGPIVLISVLLIAGKTVSVMMGALLSGLPLKQSVQTGVSLAQIGEFSYIIAALGLSLKVTSPFLYPIAVAVSAVTAFTTPYMIRSAEPLYLWLEKTLPHGLKSQLTRYSTGAQTISAATDWKILLKGYIWRVVTNSVVIIALFLVSIKYVEPFFSERIEKPVWAVTLTILSTLLVAAPFLWALAIGRSHKKAFQLLWGQKKYRGPILVLELSRIYIATLLIAFLFAQFPFTVWTLALPLIALGIGMTFFRQKLQDVYHSIENKFLSNLHLRENKTHDELEPSAALAPWDAHIAYFVVQPFAPCLGRTLLDLKIREKFGVTIALIQRGQKKITAPGGDIQIFPNDRLGVIGTDEQLVKFKDLVAPEAPSDHEIGGRDFSLQKIILTSESRYISKTIRESGLREDTQGLVVGVERQGQRLLNPDSSLKFEPDDLVWIVGDAELIRKLLV